MIGQTFFMASNIIFIGVDSMQNNMFTLITQAIVKAVVAPALIILGLGVFLAPSSAMSLLVILFHTIQGEQCPTAKFITEDASRYSKLVLRRRPIVKASPRHNGSSLQLNGEPQREVGVRKDKWGVAHWVVLRR